MSTDLVAIPVPGTDRQIMAAVIDGKPMVSLRHACEAIGLAHSSQLEKLRRRSWAVVRQEGMTGADGKTYQMAAIDRRTFTMWLGGLDENRVSDEAKPILVSFQAEAADALDAYFNEGGAINPRATEDQVERLSREIQAQAAVLKSLKGIVDPQHLEAKGRILLARALGEAPELDVSTTPLYVWDYLKSKGLRPDMVAAKAKGFGMKVRALYVKKYDRVPAKHFQEVDGRPREVNAYMEADRPLFDSVWAHHYDGVIAENALMLIPGGERA